MDPALVPFPVDEAAMLLRREKSHLAFIDKSKTIVESAKPTRFNQDMKWEDWAPTFINFLRSIPGRDGVPLSYIVRTNDVPDPTPNMDYLDDYVAMAPLTGATFNADAAEVHTYLVKFMTGNHIAESKIQPNLALANGRLDFKSLTDHYEGVGINSVDLAKAEKILSHLFYQGEKKPHMWWEEFKKKLRWAFAVHNKKEKRVVYSDIMRL